MPSTGSLAVTVHRIEANFVEEEHTTKGLSVRFGVGSDVHHTKYKKHDEKIDETLHLYVKNAAASEEVVIDVAQSGRKNPLVSTKQPLSDFFTGFVERKMTFTFGPKATPNTVLLYFNVKWTPDETTLSKYEVHRPWFMTVSYYYDTSKKVYNYTTSFRVVAPFARFGESTTDKVLTKVTGKTLHDVDESLLTPVLHTVDAKVDATISTVASGLHSGQQYALHKKDEVVGVASSVAQRTGETVSSVVGSTLSTAGKAKNYTTTKVTETTSAVYGKVSSVADYATTQVVHASSSTYGTVRGVTMSALSYVPVIGPKIVA